MLPTRLLLLVPVIALVTACATPSQKAPAEKALAPEAAPTEPAPAAAAVPATPATQQQAQKTAIAAADLLEAGNEEQAKAELQRALAGDPNNRLAQNLMRQITADPVAVLGRESFPYTVRASDTLSRIAGRFLGDIYAFYILARYNDIKVPRQVAGGQVIRIPGKAPPPGALERDPRRPDAAGTPAATTVTPVASPAPTPAPAAAPAAPEASAGDRALASAEAAERGGDLEKAYAEYRRASGLELLGDQIGRAEQLRRRLVSKFTVNARSAFAKQDLDGSIRHWERVIQIDPSNDTARLEQQKARTLKEKVKSLK